MSYTPNTWADRVVSTPLTFSSVTNGDASITLTPVEGTISQAGTPFTATWMNHLETQYAQALADAQTSAQWRKVTTDAGASFLNVTSGDLLALVLAQKGFYTVTCATGVTNMPFTSGAGFGIAFVDTSNNGYILLTNTTNADMKINTAVSGAWQGWKKVLSMSGGANATAWSSLSLTSGATSGYGCGYKLFPDNTVKLRGQVIYGAIAGYTAGTTTIATVPAGYRPPYKMYAYDHSNAGDAWISVDTDGTIKTSAAAGASNWIFLDTIHYDLSSS